MTNPDWKYLESHGWYSVAGDDDRMDVPLWTPPWPHVRAYWTEEAVAAQRARDAEEDRKEWSRYFTAFLEDTFNYDSNDAAIRADEALGIYRQRIASGLFRRESPPAPQGGIPHKAVEALRDEWRNRRDWALTPQDAAGRLDDLLTATSSPVDDGSQKRLESLQELTREARDVLRVAEGGLLLAAESADSTYVRNERASDAEKCRRMAERLDATPAPPDDE